MMPGVHVDGRFASSHAADVVDARDLRPGIALVLRVRLQLATSSAPTCRSRKPSGWPKSVEPDGDMVDAPSARDRVGRLQPHLVPDRRIAGVQRRQAVRRVEAIDRLHQVEDRAAHHGLVRAPGDEPGMRHVAAGERAQHAHLAPDDVVALRAQVRRAAAQHEPAAAALELQQHVLRAAGQRLDARDLAGREALSVHPARRARRSR